MKERQSTFIDLTGTRVGKSVVVRAIPRSPCGKNDRKWELQCDCGELFSKFSTDIRTWIRAGKSFCCRACKLGITKDAVIARRKRENEAKRLDRINAKPLLCGPKPRGRVDERRENGGEMRPKIETCKMCYNLEHRKPQNRPCLCDIARHGGLRIAQAAE